MIQLEKFVGGGGGGVVADTNYLTGAGSIEVNINQCKCFNNINVFNQFLFMTP